MKDKRNTKKKILWIAGIAAVIAVSVSVICFIRMNAEQMISGDWELIVNPEIADSADSSRKYIIPSARLVNTVTEHIRLFLIVVLKKATISCLKRTA